MQAKLQRSLEQIFPMLFQAVVGIVGLLILWLIISALPMLQDIDIPLEFTLTELLKAAILTAVIVILVNFGSRLELRLGHILPGFPESGTIVKLTAYLVSILIAYRAYLPIVMPYAGTYDWIYSLLFLVLFLVVLFVLAYSIYQNVEKLVSLFIGKKPGIPSSEALEVACAKCGELNRSGSKFCSICGVELPQIVLEKCKGCGAPLKPNTKFCASCGTLVTESGPSKEPPVSESAPSKASAASEEIAAAPACVSCGAMLKSGAKFCASCGTLVTETGPSGAPSVSKPAPPEEPAESEEKPIEPACVSCGAKLKPGAKFCASCGTSQS